MFVCPARARPYAGATPRLRARRACVRPCLVTWASPHCGGVQPCSPTPPPARGQREINAHSRYLRLLPRQRRLPRPGRRDRRGGAGRALHPQEARRRLPATGRRLLPPRGGHRGRRTSSYVGFYDKPLLKFERLLETYLGVAPRGFRSFLMAGPLWLKEKLFTDRQLRDELATTTARSSTPSTTSRTRRARSSRRRSRRPRS